MPVLTNGAVVGNERVFIFWKEFGLLETANVDIVFEDVVLQFVHAVQEAITVPLHHGDVVFEVRRSVCSDVEISRRPSAGSGRSAVFTLPVRVVTDVLLKESGIRHAFEVERGGTCSAFGSVLITSDGVFTAATGC